MPKYFFLRDETDASEKGAIHLAPKEVDILFRIRNHTSIESFFSGKILRIWKDETAKVNHTELLIKLSNSNLILIFPEFRFKPETKELLVYLNLISGKEFRVKDANIIKEIYLNSLSRSSSSIQNYILTCEPYHLGELNQISDFLTTETEGTFLRDSFDCNRWIHSFCNRELIKDDVYADCVRIILEMIHENEQVVVTKTVGLFHVSDHLASDAFEVIKHFYLKRLIPKIMTTDPEIWSKILEARKTFEIDLDFEGSFEELESTLLSQELSIISKLMLDRKDKIADFLILANYISQKNDSERNMGISAQEVQSIKLLKTMMSMNIESLSKFVLIDLEENREFSYKVIEQLRKDPECIADEWYEGKRKVNCIFYNKPKNVEGLLDIMINEFSYKKDILKCFLFALIKNKKNFPTLFSNPKFHKKLFQLQFLCFENNLSWFGKVLHFIHAYGWLESSLDKEVSRIQFDQISKKMDYTETRKRGLEKIKQKWVQDHFPLKNQKTDLNEQNQPIAIP
ncbi:hypothetical protein A0128_19740 [Leptospira tipperaryensis]|uniref:Exonuclease n=2 Tax=Leptospira tipperaryensis TaxID=2564040 RepID=A0A1D7V349_9LEPT|nr:hypothetical protein A0128_19740 [Leptospira tipperaryensis]